MSLNRHWIKNKPTILSSVKKKLMLPHSINPSTNSDDYFYSFFFINFGQDICMVELNCFIKIFF